MTYTKNSTYRKSSIKHNGIYSKLNGFGAALNRGRCLLESGTYSKANIVGMKSLFLFL